MIYISGPITGRPIEEAVVHFEKASDYLWDQQLHPSNPITYPHNHDRSWESYMKEDITEMMKCDGIYMLVGWEKSRGATIEHQLAKDLGFTIHYEPRT